MKAMRQMIFWGARGQAKVLRECLKDSGMRLVALFDNDESVPSPMEGIPLFYGKKGFERWLRGVKKPDTIGFLAAMGGERGKDRVELQEYLEAHGLIALTAIHPSAFVADTALIGAGSQILANAAVCVDTGIGRGCIINTGATVDHECRLGDGVHIAPGANLASYVEVGDHATVYTGAVVLPRIKIGKGAVVGAGAVVIRDVSAGATVAGNPAQPIRQKGRR